MTSVSGSRAAKVDPIWVIGSIELVGMSVALIILAPFAGWCAPLAEIPDAVFAQRHAR